MRAHECTNKYAQASWVGRGWSLDPGGFIARTKNLCCSDWDSFSFSAMGRSFDIVRGTALSGTPPRSTLSAWRWHMVDEAYWRIEVTTDGYWTIWSPDGTRYEFRHALRWPGHPDRPLRAELRRCRKGGHHTPPRPMLLIARGVCAMLGSP